MRRDPWAIRDVAADYGAISGAKQKARRRRLEKLKPYVIARFWQYWIAQAAPETIAPRDWAEANADALRHCYGSGSQSRSALMNAIEEVVAPTPYFCPYCLLRQPGSFDHFLPQAQFPEFSILAWNLVFVCETCNRRKGEHFVGTPRAILNPYFDPIPDSALLHAEMTIQAGRPRLRFFIATTDPTVPNSILQLAERHLAALEIAKDIARIATSFVSTIVQAFAAQGPAPITAQELAEELDKRMHGLSEYPVNHWEAAVIAALESEPGFLAYVNARIAAVPRPPRLRPLMDRTALRTAAQQAGTAAGV